MSSLTVATLMQEKILPKHTFLVSGHAQTAFNWVRLVTSETEVSEKAAPGELILVSPSMFEKERDPSRTLTQVIARLIQARIPAFCIQGAVDIAALEDAIRHEMTVVYVPSDASFSLIERAALRMLTDQQLLIEEYERSLQQAISRPGNSYQNLAALVQVMATLLERPIALHDAYNLRLTHALPQRSNSLELVWRQHLTLLDNNHPDLHTNMVQTTLWGDWDALENEAVLRIPLASDTETIGYLSIVKGEHLLSETAPLVIKRGLTLCTQQLIKFINSVADNDPTTNWVVEWLRNPPANDILLSARAEQIGFDSEQTYVVMVMRHIPQERSTRVISPSQFAEFVANETRTRRFNALVGHYVDRAVLLLPLEKAQHTGRMKQYARAICERAAEALGGIVVGGVGRPGIGLTELRHSFADADRAQVLADQLWDGSPTKFYGDLRMSEILMSIGDIDRLRRFYTDWLSSILEYDQESRSELLLTMTAYFANNGNMAATAKQLSVHRNTLVYRLNRIAEITQLDMDDADVQLNLHLAIKAYHLLETLSSPPKH